MDVTISGIELSIDETSIAAPTSAIRRQVAEYKRGERHEFDLEVTIPETLTGAVMAAMVEIPFGETRTYGQIAEAVASSPVAVGQACGRNPVPIVVPCHRVVGADSIGGFSAAGDRGVELKRALLEHERAVRGTGQARLDDFE